MFKALILAAAVLLAGCNAAPEDTTPYAPHLPHASTLGPLEPRLCDMLRTARPDARARAWVQTEITYRCK